MLESLRSRVNKDSGSWKAVFARRKRIPCAEADLDVLRRRNASCLGLVDVARNALAGSVDWAGLSGTRRAYPPESVIRCQRCPSGSAIRLPRFTSRSALREVWRTHLLMAQILNPSNEPIDKSYGQLRDICIMKWIELLRSTNCVAKPMRFPLQSFFADFARKGIAKVWRARHNECVFDGPDDSNSLGEESCLRVAT